MQRVYVWVSAAAMLLCAACASPPRTAVEASPVLASRAGGSSAPASDIVSAGFLDRLFDWANRALVSGDRPMAKPAEMAIIATYRVEGDALLEIESTAEEGADGASSTPREIWEHFTALVPANYRSDLKRFILFTDGPAGTLASVEPEAEDRSRWSLSVDLADVSDARELTGTLLHELGHLLTLNRSQISVAVPAGSLGGPTAQVHREAGDCESYASSIGCSRPDSYLNNFFTAFWADIYGEHPAESAEDREAFSSALERYYTLHQDRFDTQYSATSPEEDIAESFADFVLTTRPRGDTIVEQKVLFFYNYPELVELREEIVSRLAARHARDWLR